MEILTKEMILLDQTPQNKEETIRLAGQLLVDGDRVNSAYIDSMLDRENTVSTYMGNFLAIPHGTDEGKGNILASGISFVQIPNGVSFGPKPDQVVKVVMGIAEKNDEHIELLSKIAIFCSDTANVDKLVEAQTAEEILDLLGGAMD